MKKIFMALMSFVVIFGLTSCDKASNLEEAWASLSQDIVTEVTDSFTIQDIDDEYADVVVTWTSSNTDVLANDGTVTTPIFDTVVVVTVNLANEETNESHDINVTVKGFSATERISAAKDMINVSNVEPNLDFSSIEEMYGVDITFTSSNDDVIDSEGIITQNGLEQTADLSFVITDTLDITMTDTFVLTANVLPVSDEEQVDYVLSMLTDYTNVTDDITLTTAIEGYTPVISWVSNTPNTLTNAGVLNQPVNSVDVVLTATASLGLVTKTKTVTVYVAGFTDTQRVEAAKTEYTLLLTTVSENFTLDETANYDTDIHWTCTSNYIVIVGNQAIVTRPTISETDAVVTLTAEFVYENASVTKDYSISIPKHTYTSYTFQVPTVSEYVLEDTIDLTGGSFAFILDDSESYVVNLVDSMIDVTLFNQTGEILITAQYLEETQTFTVYVYEAVEDKLLAVDESVIEDFTDIYSPQLSFNNEQVPNSTIIDEATGALSGNSYYFESEGNYKTLFIDGGVSYEANETYRITFDYKVTSFVDTIYFQLNGGASGNLFTQFGSPSDIDTWQSFSYVVTLADTTDYLIQIFPGGGTGITSVIMDNITIEHICSEPAKTVDGEIAIGDYVLETFGDLLNAPFTQDLSPTPNSKVIGETEDSIDGISLYVESPGSYTGIYLNETFEYTPSATYRITFDYKITELADTIYFQLNGGASGNLFTEFGSIENLNTVQTFSWDVTLADTSDYIIQIFPGGAATSTKVMIDNLKIERVTGETSLTTQGELAEGEYVLETFGDSMNQPFTLDLTPTANSAVVTSSNLDYSALYIESDGSYNGIYINENFQYTPLATYRITFDYELDALTDTIYFQLTSPAGNQFTQFGTQEEIGGVHTFTWDVALADSSDYIIQIFPAGGVGKTAIYLDNLKIERLAVETSVTTANELTIGESVMMSFGDPANEPFILDLSPTPNSEIITDSELEGCALNYQSPGSYTGIFLNENFQYTALATYRITFTYQVVSFADTLYFQLTGPAGNLFTQFGSVEQVGTTQTFTWDVTLGDSSDYIIQLFPGGSTEVTNIIIDNIIVERIS